MKNTYNLTQGAILLAALIVLILMNLYIPFIGGLLNFVLPAPFIVFASKSKLKLIIAFYLAALFISFILGSFLGLGLVLVFGSVGIAIGYLIQKNKSRTMMLITSTLLLILSLVILYIGTVAIMKIDIIHEFTKIMNESQKSSEQMLKALGQEQQIEKVKEQTAATIKSIQLLAPSYLIIMSISTAFIIQWVCFPIVKRLGVKIVPWGHFRNLTLPRSLMWYYVLTIVLSLVLQPKEGNLLFVSLINVKYILEMFFIFQGFAFILYLLHQRAVGKGIQILVILLAFMIPIFHYIIMLLGIMDIGFDYRKRFEKKE